MLFRERLIPLLIIAMVVSPVGANGAQDTSVDVRGTVVDVGGSAVLPIAGVTVSCDSLSITTRTNSVGEFWLAGLSPGVHTLRFRKDGFAPRDFPVIVPKTRTGELHVGVIALEAGPLPTAAVSGVVTDRIAGRPVVAATVILNGSVITATDSAGAFAAARVMMEWGENILEVRRIGYSAVTDELWVTDYDLVFDLDLRLGPVSVELPEIVVESEGDPSRLGRLHEFHRRQGSTLGHFITREEIERQKVPLLTDLLRRIPGVVVSRDARGSNRVQMKRVGGRCEPAVLLDGARLTDADIDARLAPEDVAGIEVYAGPAQAPAEFGGAGLGCGLIVIWTVLDDSR